MVYPNYFLFLFHLCIINLRLGTRSSISSASSSRIFPPLFFSFCKHTSIWSPSASSPHIVLHNFSFLSTILHLLFSFSPQPTSYSPLFYYCSISWTFFSLSYFPVNTRDIFLTEGHFVESTLLAFKLQAIPAFVHFPYAFILSYFHMYPCLSPLTAIPSILYSFVRY